jgi:hypothetical protein
MHLLGDEPCPLGTYKMRCTYLHESYIDLEIHRRTNIGSTDARIY